MGKVFPEDTSLKPWRIYYSPTFCHAFPLMFFVLSGCVSSQEDHSFSNCNVAINVRTRDRPIYRPIFGFCRYIGIGQNRRFYRPQRVLTKRCYIVHASRQLAQPARKHNEASQDNYLAVPHVWSASHCCGYKFTVVFWKILLEWESTQ